MVHYTLIGFIEARREQMEQKKQGWGRNGLNMNSKRSVVRRWWELLILKKKVYLKEIRQTLRG